MEFEKDLGEFLNRPYFRLAFIIVCVVLLSFVSFKEGFSIWILSKLHLSKERLNGTTQASINALYPGVHGSQIAANKQLKNWVSSYNSS